MTPRERMLAVLSGSIPDCVPVCPDFSNMIPAKLTGKPFWDLYLYHDPPIWEAYVAAAKHFNIDSLMDLVPFEYPWENSTGEEWERFVVLRTPERIVTQLSRKESGNRVWASTVDVYYVVPVKSP